MPPRAGTTVPNPVVSRGMVGGSFFTSRPGSILTSVEVKEAFVTDRAVGHDVAGMRMLRATTSGNHEGACAWQENGDDNSIKVQLVAVCRELPEALDEGDGAGLWCGEVAGTRDAALPGGDGADDEAADPRGPGGVAGEPQTQRLGQ